jgi:hypothetical protein
MRSILRGGNAIDSIPFRLGFVAFDVYSRRECPTNDSAFVVALLKCAFQFEGGSRGVQIKHDIEQGNFIFIYLLCSTCTWTLHQLLLSKSEAIHAMDCCLSLSILYSVPRFACDDILPAPLLKLTSPATDQQALDLTMNEVPLNGQQASHQCHPTLLASGKRDSTNTNPGPSPRSELIPASKVFPFVR